MAATTLPTSEYLLAKFYDPLYFDHVQDDADPFLCVDRAYTHEAAAYEMLKPLQGTIIPRYYGSFTLELSIPNREEATRSVRFILLELVAGIDMTKLNPADFPQETRQELMKAIIDAESFIYTHNIQHGDIHLRNVLILQDSIHTTEIQVMIIDFGHSQHRVPYWSPRFTPEDSQRYLPGVYISPILRWAWRQNRARRFSEWIDWDWEPWLNWTYESTKESITDHMLYLWGPPIRRPAPWHLYRGPGF